MVGQFERVRSDESALSSLPREISEPNSGSSAELYRQLVENANDLIYSIDLQGNFTSVNRAAVRVSGYSRREVLDMNVAHLVAPEFLDAARQMIQRTLRGESPGPYDLEIVAKDGRRLTLEVSHRLLVQNGMPMGTHAIAREITERRRAEALDQDRIRVLEMIATRRPLDGILDHLAAMVERQRPGLGAAVMSLRDGRLYCVASRSLPEAFVKRFDGLWIGPMSASCGAAAYWRQAVISGDIASDPLWEGYRQAALDNGLRACWSVPIVAAAGHPLGTFAVYERKPARPDKSLLKLLKSAGGSAAIAIEQRQMTDQLAYQAHHDALTGLPNRLLFQERMNQAIAAARRNQSLVALLYVDLDRFKMINDTLGHPAGDTVLQETARRLGSAIRETDTLARMSGDEFTVLATGLRDKNGAHRLAEAILDRLREPFQIEGQELFLSASVGVSFYPDDAADSETLLRNSDGAMYRAKNSGKNRYQYFDPDISEEQVERLSVENNLRRAIERGELAVHYQPQVDLVTGQTSGQEALLRWNHPKLGVVAPDRFIPIAEESGLIVEIGAWVLRESCRQACAWHLAGYSRRTISVNVSPVQFTQPDFVQTVEDVLRETGLDPSCLELELTESLVMRDVELFVRKMTMLRKLGVRIAVDDFGTGYSSLSRLQRLPIDILKLDRSFMVEMKHSANGPSLVRGIVTMAHSLGMQVTAEGVETEQQLDAVQACGCDKAQGYLLGRPRPADTHSVEPAILERFCA